MPETTRRAFLALAALGIAGACVRRTTSTSPTTSAPATPSASPPTKTVGKRALAWRKLDAEGPKARRDHTFTGVEGESLALLFGGRAQGEPLGDLWLYDAVKNRWSRVESPGPEPRFGHNAVFVRDQLIVFGGQGRGSDFFNDVWAFNLESGRWAELEPGGTKPAKRYGSSGALVGNEVWVSHGFTFEGRFDDTRALERLDRGGRWSNLTPQGARPRKRCLHRAVALGDRMVLFGGQTTGTPFLGDTWLFDGGRWREIDVEGPGARNLYAFAGRDDGAYLFGGLAQGGPKHDLWRFDGARWERLDTRGKSPGARGGIEGAVLGRAMLVFGGTDGTDELDDLWELTLP